MKKIISISVIIVTFLSILVFYIFTVIGKGNNQKIYLGPNGLIYETGKNELFSGTVKDTVDVIIEFQVVAGIKQGSFRTYFLTGQIEKEGYIKDNKNIGEWKYYFDNGQLETIGNFKDNLPHGQWICYYNNGVAKIIGNYKNGKQCGVWKYYDNNGKLINIIYYKNGKISSLDSHV